MPDKKETLGLIKPPPGDRMGLLKIHVALLFILIMRNYVDSVSVVVKAQAADTGPGFPQPWPQGEQAMCATGHTIIHLYNHLAQGSV